MKGRMVRDRTPASFPTHFSIVLSIASAYSCVHENLWPNSVQANRSLQPGWLSS